MRTRWVLMLVVLESAVLSAPLDAQWKPDWLKHCDACSATTRVIPGRSTARATIPRGRGRCATT